MKKPLSNSVLSLTFIFGIQAFVIAQSNLPDNGPLFLQDEVATVNIYLHPDSFDLMVTDIEYGHTHEFDATFIYTTSTFSDTIQNIGFRLRGNTSLYSAKKSFKVSFNTFSPGASYFGVEKMNLNGEHNDVSIMRSKLGWELIRNRGLPGSRTSYVRLYVNDEYRGLYLNVEHFDETFIERYYGEQIGNLYKCLWPATLEYISENPNAYKLESGGRRIYELKTNLEEDDYTGLARFINTIHNATDESFECELEEVFNVDDYLKNAALEVLLSHWDGYIVNKNNFYLYENPKTGKVEWISYDLDNTMGIDWFNVNWATTDFYNWNFESRPLYDRIMESEKYRNQFSYYIFELIASHFNPSSMVSRAYEIQDLVEDAALEDDYKGFDYGFSDQDFLDAIDQAWGSHVTMGIAEYVNARYLHTLASIEPHSDPIIIKDVKDSLLAVNSKAILVMTEGDLDSVKLDVYENNSLVESLMMFDNGFYLDGEANDQVYGQIYSTNEDKFQFQVRAFLDGEAIEKFCSPKTSWTSISANPMRINELMANNTTVITDELGEFEDWIELFNTSSTNLNTQDLFITDDIGCPNKWAFPDVNLEPIEFVLLWADNEEDEGQWHTNFRLASNGETIALFSLEDGAFRLVDITEFEELFADQPYGRVEDGFGPWEVLDIPTPGYSNIITSLGNSALDSEEITVYPNPADDYVKVKCKNCHTLYIYDVRGQLIMQKNQLLEDRLDISAIPSGFYTLVLSDNEKTTIVKLIKN